MIIKKFRKKPVVIEAVQVPKYNRQKVVEHVDTCVAIAEWCGGISHMMEQSESDNHILIKTLEGDMKALQGDFIIKGVNGEFYPCKPDIFLKTYEEVTPPPSLNMTVNKLHPSVSPHAKEDAPQS